MAAIIYSRRQLIQRIKQHVANGFPDDDFSASDNEINLMIDSYVARTILEQTYGAAKVTGVMDMPEAYIVSYSFATLTKDNVTNDWFTTLPQPPLSIPDGLNITGAYFASTGYGKGTYGLPIKSRRQPFRDFMPKPDGWSYWVKGNKFWARLNDGGSLLNQPLTIDMPSPRGIDLDSVMNLPDDAITSIFDQVTTKLLQRYQIPMDIVSDNLGAGNKGS